MDGGATDVGGHALTLLDLHDITRYELFSINCVPDTVAKHSRLLSLHLFQGIEGAISITILPNGHDGVQNEDQEDDKGFDVSRQALLTVT